TNFGGAVQAPVLEVVGDRLQFIAMVDAKVKFLHKTAPGKHLYLIDGEFGYFMEADLDGGKTYYAYVDPRIGWWKARFMFIPVTRNDLTADTFKKDFAWCVWHENTPEGHQWFAGEQQRLEARYSDRIRDYSRSRPEDKVRMLPEYGVVAPVQ
ncbi:MAG: hypothetical protein LBV01_01045, partial [Deltaproteobacteria bacterium]|nr:hypothetical protein [Deltaproteobacteria bacterium]